MRYNGVLLYIVFCVTIRNCVPSSASSFPDSFLTQFFFRAEISFCSPIYFHLTVHRSFQTIDELLFSFLSFIVLFSFFQIEKMLRDWNEERVDFERRRQNQKKRENPHQQIQTRSNLRYLCILGFFHFSELKQHSTHL